MDGFVFLSQDAFGNCLWYDIPFKAVLYKKKKNLYKIKEIILDIRIFKEDKVCWIFFRDGD